MNDNDEIRTETAQEILQRKCGALVAANLLVHPVDAEIIARTIWELECDSAGIDIQRKEIARLTLEVERLKGEVIPWKDGPPPREEPTKHTRYLMIRKDTKIVWSGDGYFWSGDHNVLAHAPWPTVPLRYQQKEKEA